MPHLVILYTGQLDAEVNMTTLCRQMADAMLTVKDDIWRILALTPGVMSAHYSIEYRTHFTGVHTLVVGFIGATE